MSDIKFIFLDFDGVITTFNSRWNSDNEKCLMIKRLCDETGAKIVISSSWRYYSLEDTIEKNHLDEWILKDYCYGVTKRFYAGDLEEGWMIPRRGIEIKSYLEDIRNKTLNENISYVILDDDVYDMLYCQRGHIIKTDWKDGVCEEDITRAIKILNGEDGEKD